MPLDDNDRAYEAHVADTARLYPWQDSYWNFCPFTEIMSATADEIPFVKELQCAS